VALGSRTTPLRVGLTGGIASGKSTIADMFAEHGVPVIDTDVIAREVVAPGRPALDEIRSRFGTEVFTDTEHLDRAALRKVIFENDQAREDLEAILHPLIGRETRRLSREAGGAYQIIVVPLLVESSLRGFVDRILVVDCDEETQIERLLARDAESRSQARRILAAQASREERLAIADDLIDNSSDLDSLRARVDELDVSYRSLARQRDRRAPRPGSA
jgi:dephospho-CoA kinase